MRTKPPSVEVVTEALVPPEFIRFTLVTSVDKRPILDQIKSTGELPDGITVIR
jgi:hypothetical protein